MERGLPVLQTLWVAEYEGAVLILMKQGKAMSLTNADDFSYADIEGRVGNITVPM
jgi:hypothetical protein